MRHKPELDGIRGIAILAVLFTHSARFVDRSGGSATANAYLYLVGPGWAGVDLFFVLSGFLITDILLRTKTASNRWASFYGRRVLRIFPLYYSFLVSLCVASALSPVVKGMLPPDPARRIGLFIYMQNWLSRGEFLTRHLWSLAVEEQFYLIWPFLVWKLPRKYLLWICCLGFLAMVPERTLPLIGYSNAFIIRVNTARIDGLLIGAACAIFTQEGKLLPLKWIGLAVSVSIVLLTGVAVTTPQEFLGGQFHIFAFGVPAFVLLSASLLAISQYHFGGLQSVLCMPLLRQFGKYSYGLYILHWPIYEFFGRYYRLWRNPLFPVTLMAIFCVITSSFIVAKFSFNNFEARFIALKNRFSPQFQQTSPLTRPSYRDQPHEELPEASIR